MKAIITAAALSLVAVPAFAQMSQTVTTTTISPDDETQMREYIVREHPPVVAMPQGFSVTTGAVLPEAVKIYNFPAERHWTYEYATVGDRTVLVEPSTRKIVRVIP